VLTVVKLGGRPAGSPEGLLDLVRKIGELAGDVVVVHGGGADITRWQERLALPVEWRDGLRVTTPEAMQVTAMVLSGWINKRVVSAFVATGRRAVGLSGEDAGIFRADRKDGGKLGEVGSVTSVDPAAVAALLDAGFLPVVSPVSRGPAGEPLNVNADEAAIALATALEADRLLLLSDVPGVMVGGVVIRELGPVQVVELVSSGVASGGMRVKVEMALQAARQGMQVRIGDQTLLAHASNGTRVVDRTVPVAVGVA
jgi:acetylglutamate kinase